MSQSVLDFLAAGLTGSPWPLVLGWFLLVTQLTIFAVTLYLHRSATHRAVDFHPVISHFFRFWTWLTTAMVTREWVAIHRKHHARCETDEDPHSPQVYGIGRVLFHGVELYQQARKDPEIVAQFGAGVVDDRIERALYSPYPWLGPTLMAVIDILLFGAVGLAIWAIQMLWIPVMAAGVVNGLGHWWGYRNFETPDRSTNLSPWGLVIGGEELHNNHHAFPSSARFSMRRHEFDIGWQVIRLLQALRLAKVLRVAPSLAERPNISVPDAETVRALVAHRFAIATQYFRTVIVPVLKDEMARAGDSAQRLRGRLRRALMNDGRWLDESTRQRLQDWVAERPLLATVIEYRRRLHELTERSGRNTAAMREALAEWCAEAERSGIAVLQQFAQRLRGISLQPA